MTGTGPTPPIVVLCGSTRFRDEFHYVNRMLTLAGSIVLAPGAYLHADDLPAAFIDKQAVDELHRAKIRLADRVLIINLNGYIGESTAAEIAYAKQLGKPVSYLRPDTEAIR